MKLQKTLITGAIGAVTLFGLMAQTAFAIPQLRLQSGMDTVLVTDQCDALLAPTCVAPGAETHADSNGIVNIVGYSGSVGNFDVNLSTGFVLGGAQPHLDLFTANFGAGMLTISFTELYVGPGSIQPGLVGSIGGTTDGTVEYSAFWGANPFATTNPVGGTGVLTPSGGSTDFSGNFFGPSSPGTPFYLTQIVKITHANSCGGFGSQNECGTTLDADLQPVPEPGTMMLMGSGLLGLGLWRRFKK